MRTIGGIIKSCNNILAEWGKSKASNFQLKIHDSKKFIAKMRAIRDAIGVYEFKEAKMS